MNPPELARQYLLDFLKDEFEKYPEVRLRIVPNYQEDGVIAKTESREYFFHTDWVRSMRLDLVREEARRIKEVLGERY